MAAAVIREPAEYPCTDCDCDPQGQPPDGGSWLVKSLRDHEGRPLEFHRCPRQLISTRSWLMLDLYQHYRRGVLLVGGGLLEQPYCYTRAMAVLDAHLGDGR